MRRIFVIDDNPMFRQGMCELLALSGYDAVEAAEGEQVLGLLQDCIPDLIISEMKMSKTDGCELLQAMRSSETFAKIPFIFLSAEAMPDDIKHGLSMGANAYLTKPFPIADLINTVDELLGHEE